MAARKYEGFACPACGKQIQRATESCMGVDGHVHPNTHAESVTAYDARDVAPIIAAACALLKVSEKALPWEDRAYVEADAFHGLRAALAPFDSEEG